MPDTALALLAKFADRFGLTMEQVRFLRRVVRLACRERSAALLRRVVAGLVREREQLRRVVVPLVRERDAARAVVASLAERVAKQSDLLSRKAERSGGTP